MDLGGKGMMSAFNSQMVQQIHYKYTHTHVERERETETGREENKI